MLPKDALHEKTEQLMDAEVRDPCDCVGHARKHTEVFEKTAGLLCDEEPSRSCKHALADKTEPGAFWFPVKLGRAECPRINRALNPTVL